MAHSAWRSTLWPLLQARYRRGFWGRAYWSEPLINSLIFMISLINGNFLILVII